MQVTYIGNDYYLENHDSRFHYNSKHKIPSRNCRDCSKVQNLINIIQIVSVILFTVFSREKTLAASQSGHRPESSILLVKLEVNLETSESASPALRERESLLWSDQPCEDVRQRQGDRVLALHHHQTLAGHHDHLQLPLSLPGQTDLWRDRKQYNILTISHQVQYSHPT